MAYQCAVIGAGHAGIEAANILNQHNIQTIIITQNINKSGFPSCNPSIGGIAKSHLVYELDALGGIMPICADDTGIHFKLLNSSKGPAVWSLRGQIDVSAYTQFMKSAIEKMKNVDFIEDEVIDISYNEGGVNGIHLSNNSIINVDTIILCAGTFLNGRIFIGNKQIDGGRYNDKASAELVNSLKKIGLKTGRLKTGTSPRVKRNSVDFALLEKQPGEENTGSFSIISNENVNNSENCYITHTNEKTHAIINENLHYSSLYSGQISGIGPKYCPSIEDKIVRFSHRNSHTVFIEPMGINSDTLYVNGISTSLPEEKQYAFIRTIKGLENAEFEQPGYAIEYDYFTNSQIANTLESNIIKGLFLAGQVNGTSGYEEAAAQGFVAGLNAAMKLLHREPIVFDRYNSYIGVLIDDITTREINEPYRLFTSRSENRLFLRQDNAFLRMENIMKIIPSYTQKSYYDDLIDETLKIREQIFDSKNQLKGDFTQFRDPAAPFDRFYSSLKNFSRRACLYIYSEIKYQGYIARFKSLNLRIEKFKTYDISDINLTDSMIISKESREILKKKKIKRLGDLKGIIDPSDIESIVVYLEHKE